MKNYLLRLVFFAVLSILSATLGLTVVCSAQQNLSFFNCTPLQVASYKTYTVGNTTITGRVWVQCNPPLSSTQQYFAVPLTDAAEAARFLSLFTAAFVAGKIIEIGYTPNDTSGSLYSCNSTTLCHPAISATIR